MTTRKEAETWERARYEIQLERLRRFYDLVEEMGGPTVVKLGMVVVTVNGDYFVDLIEGHPSYTIEAKGATLSLGRLTLVG